MFYIFGALSGLLHPIFCCRRFYVHRVFGVWVSAGVCFLPEYQSAAWSFGKFLDLLGHLWIPVIVIGTSGTAGLIRVMRGNLLDELRKQYVMTARAKGVRYWVLLMRYPVARRAQSARQYCGMGFAGHCVWGDDYVGGGWACRRRGRCCCARL